MNQTFSAPDLGKNSHLQKEIENKINLLNMVENGLPGAIIIHYIEDFSVIYMNNWGLGFLGVSLPDLQQMKAEYHARFFNQQDAKEYVPKVIGLLERNNNDEFVSCFQQVKNSATDEWDWFLSSTRIFFRDKAGKPVLMLTIALPVDAQHHIANKAKKLLEENSFHRKYSHVFNALTKREKEVLKLMAMGLSSGQMAEKLHISEMTAATHRRNIKNKLNAGNNYDITMFARAFDLI